MRGSYVLSAFIRSQTPKIFHIRLRFIASADILTSTLSIRCKAHTAKSFFTFSVAWYKHKMILTFSNFSLVALNFAGSLPTTKTQVSYSRVGYKSNKRSISFTNVAVSSWVIADATITNASCQRVSSVIKDHLLIPHFGVVMPKVTSETPTLNCNWFLVDFSGSYCGSWKLKALMTSFPSSNRILCGKFCSTKLFKKSLSTSTLVPTINPLDFLALSMTLLEKDAGGVQSWPTRGRMQSNTKKTIEYNTQ